MTDLQAKVASIRLLREWAEESGDDMCEECGGIGHIYHSPADGQESVCEFCAVCNGTGRDQGFDIEEFIKHLLKAPAVVLGWQGPEWKQNILASP